MPPSSENALAQLRERIAQIEKGEGVGPSRGVRPTTHHAGTTRSRAAHPDRGSASANAHRARDSRRDDAGGEGEAVLDADAAIKRIVRLCAQREQASSALAARLAREGFPEEAAQEAVMRAVSWGLVDDARYADALVRGRLASGRGLAGIARELEDLGISPDEVEAFAEASAEGEEREAERALSLLERKPPRAKNQRDAAYRRLVQKGYSSAAASRAARLWSERQRP